MDCRVDVACRSACRARADRAGWLPGIAVVALAVMIGVLLIARPIHELPAPAT